MLPVTPPPSSLTESAYIALRDEIVSCRLKPGMRVKIADLCNHLGTNLSAVREALARLLADGLVISEPQKGFQIAPISSKDLSDLAFARLEVDLHCLRAAMAHGGLDWETRLVAALHRIRRTDVHADGDPHTLNDDFLKAAERYFEALMSAGANQWLLRVRQQLYTQYERYRRMTMIGYPDRDMYNEFNLLTEAVLAGNQPLAEARLRELIEPSRQFLDSLLDKAELVARSSKAISGGKAPARIKNLQSAKTPADGTNKPTRRKPGRKPKATAA